MTNSTPKLNSLFGLGTLAVVLLGAGCTPWQMAKRTLFTELNEYPRVTDGRLASKQYSKWAREEWRRIAAASSESHSSDYIRGFVQGFTSFVHIGGSTDPPPVPPRRYWRVGYKNNRGQAAIQDWYNGYAHGATVADEQGYRERSTLPSSILLGYNRPITPEWERNAAADPSHPSSNEDMVNRQNEPTLADPRGQEPPVDPSQTDPFVDDPEQLPHALPVPDRSTPDSDVSDDTFAPSSDGIDIDRPEIDNAEDTNTNNGGSNDDDSNGGGVFDDLPDDEIPEIDESAFSSVAPSRRAELFDIEGSPPTPPWVKNSDSSDSFTEQIADARLLPLPTASLAAYAELTAERPDFRDRFEKEEFQSSLPEEFRGDPHRIELRTDEDMVIHDLSEANRMNADTSTNAISSGSWKSR